MGERETRSGILTVFLLCFLWGNGALVAHAREAAPGATNHTRLRLVSDSLAVEPGRMLRLGLLFDLDPHWHIYWINPGDSGEPPSVSWKLPPGFQAGGIEWPAPERLPNGPLTDYGYEGRVLLMSAIRAPQRISVQNVMLAADVRWLVCSDICITAKTSVSLDLPVQHTTPRADAQVASLFRATGARLPRPAPVRWRIIAEDEGKTFQIRLKAGARITHASFFPLDFNEVENAKPQNSVPLATGVEVTVYKSDQLLKPIGQLRGVLTVDGGRAYQVAATVQHASPVAN